MGKGKGLKAALHSQQNRLKNKEKLSHSAQITQDKSRRKGQHLSSSKGVTQSLASASSVREVNGKKPMRLSRRPTIPFKPTDKILLIGEGNFSFAHALMDDPPGDLAYLPPGNITATAYDTEDECYVKYPESQDIISSLREKGVEVLFSVDATRLEKHSVLKGRKWDRIVWNFPHAGKGITDQDRNILSNQVLLLDFLRSAAKTLQPGPIPFINGSSKKKKKQDDDEDDEDVDVADANEDDTSTVEVRPSRGTILITLRNVVPYSLWDLPRLAKNPPAPTGSTPSNPHYTLLRSFHFHRNVWKGYEHRMTKGERAHGKGTTGEGGEDRTWEFCLRDM